MGFVSMVTIIGCQGILRKIKNTEHSFSHPCVMVLLIMSMCHLCKSTEEVAVLEAKVERLEAKVERLRVALVKEMNENPANHAPFCPQVMHGSPCKCSSKDLIARLLGEQLKEDLFL
jgi:hypothetical protein